MVDIGEVKWLFENLFARFYGLTRDVIFFPTIGFLRNGVDCFFPTSTSDGENG